MWRSRRLREITAQHHVVASSTAQVTPRKLKSAGTLAPFWGLFKPKAMTGGYKPGSGALPWKKLSKGDVKAWIETIKSFGGQGTLIGEIVEAGQKVANEARYTCSKCPSDTLDEGEFERGGHTGTKEKVE